MFLIIIFGTCQKISLNFSQKENTKNLFLRQTDILERESPELILVQKNSLKTTSPPCVLTPKVFGVLLDKEEKEREIKEYFVKEGDSLWSIAKKFNISLETLLWANNLTEKSEIKPGQKLTILPISGVMHLVKSGETLSQIAKEYQANIKEIISFNELSKEGEIFVGDILIVPNGKIVKREKRAKNTPLASSYFICPISPPCHITQGLHWYNAIDFSHKGISCGEPIFAAAGGVVQKTGYHHRTGKYVRILHPNGVITLYGHLQNILVKTGQKVSQGEIIGLMGHTGYTIPPGPAGCHLHFEVRGAKNPFAR